MTPWGHAVLALSSYTNPCLQVDDAALGQTNPKPGDNQNPGTKTPKPGDRRNVFRFSPADTSPGYKRGDKLGGTNSGTDVTFSGFARCSLPRQQARRQFPRH